MFGRFIKAIKEFFVAPPIKTQFEEMVLQEAAEKKNTVPPVMADVIPSHGTHAEAKVEAVTVLAEPVHGQHSKPVDDQITDAVTTKPKRTRKAKAVEAVDAPAKKPRKKKAD